MFEHCSVIGIYSLKEKNVVPIILTSLEALQHRGQESWGIAIPHSPPYKKMDIVSLMNDEAFKEVNMMSGNVGVCHVRYTTTSRLILKNVHPLQIGESDKFNICHNGTINRELLLTHLREKGFA